MSILVPNRRGFLGGLIAAFAAPAIVQAHNIMPVRTPLIMREPIVVVPLPRWMVTEIAHSFRPGECSTARVSMVEAFGADDSPGKAVDLNACYEAVRGERVDVRQANVLGSGCPVATFRGQVHREATFSCDQAFARALRPGDIVTLTGFP